MAVPSFTADRCPWVRLTSRADPSAPRFALINGLLESTAMWTARETFAGADAIALPLPGHYPWTLAPDAAETAMAGTQAAVAHAAAIEDAFAGRPVRLVGHSAGGLAALDVARIRPDLVSDIVLFGAVADGRRGGSHDGLTRLMSRPWTGRAAAAILLRLWLAHDASFHRGVRSACAGGDGRRMPMPVRDDLRRSDPEALRRCAMAVLGRRRRNHGAVCAPTLLVMGSADPVSPPAHQLRLLDALPRAHAVVVDAGHLPNLERPALFEAAIRSWDGAAALNYDPPARAEARSGA